MVIFLFFSLFYLQIGIKQISIVSGSTSMIILNELGWEREASNKLQETTIAILKYNWSKYPNAKPNFHFDRVWKQAGKVDFFAFVEKLCQLS